MIHDIYGGGSHHAAAHVTGNPSLAGQSEITANSDDGQFLGFLSVSKYRASVHVVQLGGYAERKDSYFKTWLFDEKLFEKVRAENVLMWLR